MTKDSRALHINIHAFRKGLEWELEALLRAHQHIERIAAEKALAPVVREDPVVDIDELLDAERDFGQDVPRFHRQGTFLTAYGLIEHQLTILCEYLHRTLKTNVGPRDLRDSGVTRCRTFLEKVVDIDDAALLDCWVQLAFYARVRNVLVHAYGELDEANSAHKQLAREIEHRTDVGVSTTGYLELSPQFVPTFLEVLRDCVAVLVDELVKATT